MCFFSNWPMVITATLYNGYGDFAYLYFNNCSCCSQTLLSFYIQTHRSLTCGPWLHGTFFCFLHFSMSTIAMLITQMLHGVVVRGRKAGFSTETCFHAMESVWKPTETQPPPPPSTVFTAQTRVLLPASSCCFSSTTPFLWTASRCKLAGLVQC